MCIRDSRYTPDGTLRSRWYLVTVDLQQTAAEVRCGDPHETGWYYVHFLARHPADSDETDPQARWWPEWHEYRTDKDGTIDYGARYLVIPNRIPAADRYIAWADIVNLCDQNTRLPGPFNFQDPSLNPPGRSPSYRQYIPTVIWAQLAELCIANGILPPRLTTMTATKRSNRKRQHIPTA